MAVTAACMLTPRQLFLETGGFDETRFPVAYNDADYGYRLVDAGYRCVYCAEAELYHHEGLSRGLSSDPRELAMYRQVHGHRIDPYFNPHLDPEIETFATKPTVVPVEIPHRPTSVLAFTHNLNWEGAPRFELELLSRLKASGTIAPLVLSPCDGPVRREFNRAGIEVRVETKLACPAESPALYRDSIARLADLIREGRYEVVHANTLQTFWAIEAATRWGSLGLERARERTVDDVLRRLAPQECRVGPRLPCVPLPRHLFGPELCPGLERPQLDRKFRTNKVGFGDADFCRATE